MAHPRGKTEGLALLLVVGVVSVMSALGLAFATLARMERQASRQRVHLTKARLLAGSALEDAMARLAAGQASAYGGEDWDASGTLNGIEPASEVFRPGQLDVATCPSRFAMRPTFFAKDPASLGADGKPAPIRLRANGRELGFSGRLGAGLAYALKVEDESAKLNINGGFLDAGDRDADGIPDHQDADVRATPADPGSGWNFQLARVLDLLGAQAEVSVPNLGTRTLQARPPGGYRSVAALEAALGVTADLSPYLTVSSWIDAKVIHPNNAPSGLGPFTSMSALKLARTPLLVEEGGRPPVNLNAASRPVLIALLEGLLGQELFNENHARTYTVPPALAPRIADALIACRGGQDPAGMFAAAGLAAGPIRSWADFNRFCNALVPAVIYGFESPVAKKPLGGGNLAVADLIQANFDPNSRLNKTLPDQLLWRWIDKSDLLAWSTEGSLDPTGTFRLEATGRHLDGHGRLLAEARTGGTFRLFDLIRHTTQADFSAARPLQDYLSLALASHATHGAGAAWNAWNPGQGLGACTYPCAPSALPAQAADEDGWVALATTETLPVDPAGGTLRFLHRFDDGWDADVGSPASRVPGPGSPASDASLQTNATEGVWPAPPTEPSTLYPDGMHQQVDRAPAFETLGNLPPSTLTGDPAPSNHGAVGYWVKAAFRNSQFDSTYTAIHAQVTRDQAWPLTQALWMAHQRAYFGIVAENSVSVSDVARERISSVDFDGIEARLPGMRWNLMTCVFDTDQPATSQDLRARVDGVRTDGIQYPVHGAYTTPYDTLAGEDLREPASRLVLGPQRVGIAPNGIARQVLDEFAVCDFHDDFPAALAAADAWAASRFKEGRYYKGGDAAYLSPPIVLPAGAKPLCLRWTAHTPAAVRLEHRSSSGNSLGTHSRIPDPWLADDPATGSPRAWISMDLMAAGAAVTDPALSGLGQGTPLGPVPPAFRYRARFRTRLADALNHPILESPALDDVTLAWQGCEGPVALAWTPR